MFSHGCGGRPGLSIQNDPLLDSGTNQRPPKEAVLSEFNPGTLEKSRIRRMTQKIFRTLILLAISGLVISSARSQAQTTSPTQIGSPNTNSSSNPNPNPNPKPSANQ